MGLPHWLKKIVCLYDSDRRARIRIPADYNAVLSGEFGSFPVQGIDAHRDGLAVCAERALPIGARVFVHIRQHGLGGFAEVRRCAPDAGGKTYVLGLALVAPLSRSREEFQTRLFPSASIR